VRLCEDARAEQVVVACLPQGPTEEVEADPRVLALEPDLAQAPQQLGPARAGRRLLEPFLEELHRAPRGAGGVLQLGRDEPAGVSLLGKLGRRQEERLLGELGRDHDRAARFRMLGRRLQSSGDLGIRPLRREREMPRPLLRVDHGGGQQAMNGVSRARRRGSEVDRGEQRMREADLLAVKLDHAGSDRSIEVTLYPFGGTDRALDSRDRRPRQRRREAERLARRTGKLREPPMNELAQTRRHGKRLARGRLGLGPLQGAD
jgi:hypothetical protein